MGWKDRAIPVSSEPQNSSGSWRDRAQPVEETGIVANLQKFGKKVDSYTGAPSRAAASKLIEGEPLQAMTDFGRAWGNDPAKAPTAKDLAIKVGINDNNANLEDASKNFTSLKGTLLRAGMNIIPGAGLSSDVVGRALDKRGVTNADLASVPIDFATDWTNAVGLIPFGKVAAKGAKAIGGLGELIRGSRKAEKALVGLQDTVKIGEKVGDAVKVAEGIPATDIIQLANEGGRKITAKEIAEASKKLGFEPTPGMLSNDMTLKGLESSLDQSPSIGGLSVRSGKSGTNQVRTGLKNAVEKYGVDASAMSKVEVGDAVKSDMLEVLSQKHGPVSEKFNKIAESTNFIEVPEKSKEIAGKAFLRQKPVALSPSSSWGQIAARYESDLKNIKSVDDVKQIRTLALEELRGTTNRNERKVLGYIAGRLEALEGVAIKRASSASAATPAQGAKIGNDLIKELRTARKEFKGLMQPINEVAKDAGLRRPKSMKEFVNAISEIPSDQLADKLFKTNNTKGLGLLKKEFPTSFDLIRKQKIGDIIERSSVKGEINPSKLLKNLKAIGPEARELLFNSQDINQNVSALETVINALPDKIGPSGTPQGEMFTKLLNVPFQGTELGRAATYKALQNPTIPFGTLKKTQDASRTIPFSKAGQATVGGLSDLLNQIQLGTFKVNEGRTIQNAITPKERK